MEERPRTLGACSSVVERTPDKGEVVGSIPTMPNTKGAGRS